LTKQFTPIIVAKLDAVTPACLRAIYARSAGGAAYL